ncbi:MAG: GNAT family N-acetyltransferase [Bacteroidales bacterium]|nr:GNAT family N-acetyltransferase [Bacteroidales bacterium]
MIENFTIKGCTPSHLEEYGKIYAEAFGGEPWNDHWSVEDATVHVKELLDSPACYGLEYLVDGEVAGFILGTSMLFSYGRTFEINDLAVAPAFQGKGIGTLLMERMLSDLRGKDIKAVHLITFGEGNLQTFYAKFGFRKEDMVVLMGADL